MPFTVLSYAPQATFRFPRSYCPLWRVAWDYPNTVFDANTVFGEAPLGLDIYSAQIELKDNFWTWSSNVYTLDYPVARAEAYLNGVKYTDLSLTIQWTYNPFSPTWGFQVNHALGSPFVFDTPTPIGTEDYWLDNNFVYP